MATLGASDVHYYDWTMSSQRANNVAGSIKGIIEDCLINGLGSEPPQGSWTRLFVDGYKSAIKSTDSRSSGAVLRMDDSSTARMEVKMYESMSNIDTGENGSATYYLNNKTSLASGAYGTWFLIADSCAFYFVFSQSSGFSPVFAMQNPLFFGDYGRIDESDQHNAIIKAATTTSGSTNLADKDSFGVILRSYSGVPGNVGAASWPSYGTGGTWSGRQDYARSNGRLTISDVGVSEIDVGGSNYYRGKMPGLWNPHYIVDSEAACRLEYGQRFANVPALTPRTLMAVPTGSTNSDLLFDLTGPWR